MLLLTHVSPSLPRSGQMYDMFGFIMLAFVVLVVVCMQTSVLLCYFQLCSEDYRWWWRSFFSTGTTALYLFLFSLHYLTYKTSITGTLSYLLYFGYTFIIVFLFFIMTGELRHSLTIFREGVNHSYPIKLWAHNCIIN